MDPLTGTAAIVSAVGVACTAILVAVILMKHSSEKKVELPATIATLLGTGAAIGMSVLLIAQFAPGMALSAGIISEITPAAVGPTVGDGVVSYREGYVLAVTEDDYLIPKTAVSAATVYVSLDEPVPNASWPALVTDNTDTSGSILLTVPGITSGTVYVTAGKAASVATDLGYYPDVTTVPITGAQVISPSLVAGLELPKVGTPSWSLHENTNASDNGNDGLNVHVTGEDNIWIDVSSASGFVIRIKTDNAFHAIQDLRVLFVRGANWSALGATMSPVVTRTPSGVTVTTAGDPTLTTGVTGELQFIGDVTFGNYIEISFVVSCTATVDGVLATIYIDDLSGTYDVLGGTGVSEEKITIRSY